MEKKDITEENEYSGTSSLEIRQVRLSESAWEEDRHRARIIQSLLKIPKTSEKKKQAAANELGISKRTLSRFIELYKASGELYLDKQKRKIYKVVQEAFTANHSPAITAQYPLEIFMIDHIKIDIIIVDEQQRLPIGRSWLKLAINVFSRCIAGFYLSFKSPSEVSVGLCLTHSVFDKTDVLNKFISFMHKSRNLNQIFIPNFISKYIGSNEIYYDLFIKDKSPSIRTASNNKNGESFLPAARLFDSLIQKIIDKNKNPFLIRTTNGKESSNNNQIKKEINNKSSGRSLNENM